MSRRRNHIPNLETALVQISGAFTTTILKSVSAQVIGASDTKIISAGAEFKVGAVDASIAYSGALMIGASTIKAIEIVPA